MATKYVDAQIKDNKVVVFSKSYCPFCRMAKDTLAEAGLKDYVLIELDQITDYDESDIQDYLQKITGGRTVPRVFINKKFVGGGSEVKALHTSGKLVPMLRSAGANL